MNFYKAILLFFVVLVPNVYAADETLIIYHDSDYSNHEESATSIYQGFYTALSEVNHTIKNKKIAIVKKDHRGNSKRSLKTMKEFLKDQNALLILGGLHSPPYISYRDFINENNILLLVPWAAGAPITRYSEGKNWVFRLSVDDSKAGYRLAQFALDEKSCKQPHLLLEETGWGKGNLNTLNHAIQNRLGNHPDHTWFTWGTRFHQAKEILREIQRIGSDCIIFVGNAIEGKAFAEAMADLPEKDRLSIISHWGITGGSFHEQVPHEVRRKIELNFIQSCFTFLPQPKGEFHKTVFSRAQKLFPSKIKTPKDIEAPPGFAHGYDLGKLLIAALSTVDFSMDTEKIRLSLRNALENIEGKVVGLIKTYEKPFSKWSPDNKDAHEALGLDDICMAKYAEDDSILLHNASDLGN